MKKILLFFIITIPIIIVILISTDKHLFSYSSVGKKVNSVSEIKKEEAYGYSKKQVIYEYIYNDKCSDCISLERFMTKKLKRLSKTSTVLMINTANPKLLNYAKENSIRSTPSIIIKKNNKSVAIYSGTNKKIWNRILGDQWKKLGDKQ